MGLAARSCPAPALAVVLAAGTALSADTGMLYVKSDPPGAVVVIDGVERGKTPVLVKDLPVGATEITLRIEGAKEVTVRETVEPNKVARVSAEIDVPGASLTVISDPLEATVYLDQKEHGKTPITIDGLSPGKHELLLLKVGFPRTVRSVLLAAGEERVLEIKLGTAEEAEEEKLAARPAPARKADAGGRADDEVPVEAQLVFTMLKEAAAGDDLAKTRKSLDLALTQPDMAGFRAEIRAGIEVIRALEARRDAMVRAAEGLVGKNVSIKTRAGAREGTVVDASQKGIVLVSKIVTRGRVAGEMRGTLEWSALTPEEEDRLAESWKPEGQDAEVARAVLAMARKDEAEVARVAAVAGEHPLGKYLGRGRKGPAEAGAGDPREEWLKVEKMSADERMPLMRELMLGKGMLALKEKFGDTKAMSDLRGRMNDVLMRAKQASGLVGHWPLDEGEGAVAGDSSGGRRHGRIAGRAKWAEGKLGGALLFDGMDDLILLPAGFADLRSGFTVALWAYPTASLDWARFIDFGNGPDAGNVVFTRDGTSSALVLEVKEGSVGNSSLRAAGGIALNQWQHFAATIDASGKAAIYKNGVLVGAGTTGLPVVVVRTRNYIGKSNWPGGFYEGRMDDIRIYGRALHPEEVKALAASGD